MKDIIIKFCKEIADNARDVFDFILAVLALLSVAVISAYMLFSPIVIISIGGDWQWLLMYVVYALFLYLCYRIFK